MGNIMIARQRPLASILFNEIFEWW